MSRKLGGGLVGSGNDALGWTGRSWAQRDNLGGPRFDMQVSSGATLEVDNQLGAMISKESLNLMRLIAYLCMYQKVK